MYMCTCTLRGGYNCSSRGRGSEPQPTNPPTHTHTHSSPPPHPHPLTMAPRALAHTPLTSGTGSTRLVLRPGRTSGRYGARSFLSVREYMFPMIWPAIFLDSVERSSRVRFRVGMMRAREGGSMTWTNSVSRRA